MFCDKCGTQVSDNAKFCPRCGNRLQKTESESIDGNIEIYKKSFKKQYKSGTKKWIAIFAGLILTTAVCVVGGIFLYQNITEEEYLALVRNIDGKYGYINEQGEEVIECEYDIATDFNAKGVAAVGYKNGETYTHIDDPRDLYDWSLINTRGKEIASLDDYDAVGTLSQNGYICVGKKDGLNEDGNPIFQWGYIDSMGKEKISCKYFRDRLPESFSGVYGIWNNGLAIVEKADNSWVILNEKGEEIIERGDDSTIILNTSELYFSARQTGTDEDGYPVYEYGYVDKKGKEVIPYQFTDAEDFSENGLAAVEKQTGTDEDGEPIYKWGYINEDGETVLPFIYEAADSFGENGLALVTTEGEIADEDKFIDKQGREIITLESNILSAIDYKEIVIITIKDILKEGMISLTGDEIIPCEYDWIRIISSDGKRILLENFTEGSKSRIMGCVDENGNIILPIKYNMMKNYGANGWLPAGIKSGNYDEDTEIYRCQYFDMAGKKTLTLSSQYMDANPFCKVQ